MNYLSIGRLWYGIAALFAVVFFTLTFRRSISDPHCDQRLRLFFWVWLAVASLLGPAYAAVSGRGAGRSIFRCPGANRRQCAGAPFEPFGARLLAVEVGEADNFVAMGKPARQMDRQCRFAAAALGVGNHDRMHLCLPAR